MSTNPPLEFTTSRYFLAWLHDQSLSLAFTTYQTNRLFLLGVKPDGALSAFERLLDRPMGLWAATDRLVLSTRYQLWQFDDALPPGGAHEGYDRLYVPRRAHTTGDLDIHDIAVDGQGRVLFVNTLYSCLATTSERYSFAPVWQPPFISRLAPEDRCHLNGLALDPQTGRPRYMTAVSKSDVAAGWRDRRHAGGILLDVQANEILLDDLSMPHSPRLHNGRLWLSNAGTGDFGFVDRAGGGARFEPICFCPGFLRGLALHGRWAVVGLSKPRQNRAFGGLRLDERLREKDADPRCGLWVIDLETGNVAHWLQMEGVVAELYDVVVLPGVQRPMALGFQSDEIHRLITVDGPDGPAFEALTAVKDDGDSQPPAVEDPRQGADSRSPDARPMPQAAGSGAGVEAVLQQARAARRAGQLAEAEAYYRQAITQWPDDPAGLYATANFLVGRQRFDEAVPLYQRVVHLQPSHANAWLNLGTIHFQQGRPDQAIDHYRRAIAADPAAARAHSNLGAALHAQGDLPGAILAYQQAARLKPNDAEMLNSLGLAQYEYGQMDEARAAFRQAVLADPNSAEAHNNLAGALKLDEDFEGALRHHKRAVELKPDFYLAHQNIGKALEEQHRIREARAAYQQALAVQDDLLLALHLDMLCPPVFDSNAAIDEYRAHADQALDRYLDVRLPVDVSRLHASRAEPPADWIYQGRDDLPLKLKYARLFDNAFPPALREMPRARLRGRLPHIGFVVTPGHEGVFMRCMRGILNRLSGRKFQLTLVCAGIGEGLLRSSITRTDVNYMRFPLRFDRAAENIRAAGFDVLYYWEVGTDSTNYFLPFLRLAPAQVTGWGWPATSAAPEMDFYLTSEWLATPESDAQYTEGLMRLPSLPPFFFRPPQSERLKSLAQLGVPEDRHLYLVAQNIRKLHPDFDPLLRGILEADRQGVAVIVTDKSEAMTAMLRRRLGRTLGDLHDRIVLLPRQGPDDYFQLVAQADVCLDTLHFGGANSTYDALALGTPVVTLPTPWQRGRYTQAIYRAIGVTDCIADLAEDYVRIAARLGTEPDYRADVSARLRDGGEALFHNDRAVGEMEGFFEAVVEGG